MDENKMRKCLTKLEFESLDPSVTENKAKIDLYKANSKLCSVIGLGQSTSHGMAFLNITKSSDYSLGLAYKFMEEAMLSYKPSDEGALIELDQELNKIQLQGAREFYNEVCGVLDKYNVTKSDWEFMQASRDKECE